MKWFRSYLKESAGKCQFNIFSLCLLFGVPHVSVLIPLIFTVYTRPLGMIARRDGVGYHFHTDDARLSVSLKPDNEDFITDLNSVLDDPKSVNKLKDDETFIMYMASS